MAEISKITLPSGNTYDIKDATAREMISGGVSFIIAWDGTGTPVAANIPKGVVAGSVTGTLEAADAQSGAFYLVKSSTTPSSETLDIYDEYVVVGSSIKSWEKIGDTKLNLTDVVTDVEIAEANKSKTTVIGSSATFTNTQPTITLATDSTSGTGKVQVVTDASGSASGTGVAWNSKDQKTVLTGVQVTAQPTVTLTANAATATGRLKYVEDVTGGSTSPEKTHLSATASASGDNVTAVTGVATAKLATTTVTGVQSTTTTASKATAATSQTTADGTTTSHQGTSSSPQATYNTYMLGDVSVSNEVLSIKGLTMDTQTTTQQTFSDVTVPIKNTSATTVASGSTTSSGSGATVATGSSGTDTVLGTSSAIAVTLASGSTGDVEVVSDVSDITVSPTYKYMSGSASGTTVGSNGTATVIGSSSTFNVTDPTVTVTPTKTYIKGTASGGGAAWNSKDQKTVLTDVDVTVTKGNS